MKFVISENIRYSKPTLIAETIRVLDQMHRHDDAMEIFNESDSLWVGSPSGIQFF